LGIRQSSHWGWASNDHWKVIWPVVSVMLISVSELQCPSYLTFLVGGKSTSWLSLLPGTTEYLRLIDGSSAVPEHELHATAICCTTEYEGLHPNSPKSPEKLKIWGPLLAGGYTYKSPSIVKLTPINAEKVKEMIKGNNQTTALGAGMNLLERYGQSVRYTHRHACEATKVSRNLNKIS